MHVDWPLPLHDWSAAETAARRAEAIGAHGVTTSEIAHDPFFPLAFAAQATERVRLTTSIAVAFPRSPTITAHIAWDLQQHSRGRFVLGLGSQVKGHIERRFGVPWTAPVARLREYVEALRAVWRAWETRTPLRFEGEHYRLTLMTPEFSPEPTGLPPVPVVISAVGPDMLRMAGRVCDGVRLHGFCTRRYLEEVALPRLREGFERSGRERRRFEIWGGGFVATGRDTDELRRMTEWVRTRIGFYGSTRTYAPVLALHGWEDLSAELHRMSKEGRWNEMAARVSDDLVHEFAVIAPYGELASAVEKRFGGLVDAIAPVFPEDAPDGALREVMQDLQRVPRAFEGFDAGGS